MVSIDIVCNGNQQVKCFTITNPRNTKFILNLPTSIRTRKSI